MEFILNVRPVNMKKLATLRLPRAVYMIQCLFVSVTSISILLIS